MIFVSLCGILRFNCNQKGGYSFVSGDRDALLRHESVCVHAKETLPRARLILRRRETMYIVGCYLTYLVISLSVTVWVAHTLHKNGRVFLIDAFHGNSDLADSVNHLLVMGFYLINIGYVSVALRSSATLSSLRQAIDLVSDKIGIVLLVLGAIHFFNIFIFSRLRKLSRDVHA